MKSSATVLGLMLAGTVFGNPGSTNVTVRIVKVWPPERIRNEVVIHCAVALDNQTGIPLTATNVYSQGLALIVGDAGGKELSRAHAAPFKIERFDLRRGSETNETYYICPVPASTHVIRLHLEGELPGSSFTAHLRSAVVEAKLPP